MKGAIETAKTAWSRANVALLEARKVHRKTPTMTNWKKLVAVANRWQEASSTWSAAITAAGDPARERAAFVKATTLVLPRGRRVSRE